VIQRDIIGKPVPSLTLNLKVGQIPVTFADTLLWMKQNALTFGATCSPADVAPVLNLEVSDFDT